MDFSYSIAGFIVGTLVGATGVGGGSLMTPILMLFFGVPAATAVGTDLLFASITKGFGTAMHGFNKSISWLVVGRLCAGSVPASALTLWVLNHNIDKTAVSHVITLGLGVALLFTASAILFQPLIQRWMNRGKAPAPLPPDNEITPCVLETERICEKNSGLWRTALTGAVLGVLVSLTSVGAGALGVMVLMALYPKVRSVRIVGTDIAHAVPLTLVAGLGHASMGGVNFVLLGTLLLGSIPGIMVGSHLAFKMPERAMKHVLAAILLFVGGRLLF